MGEDKVRSAIVAIAKVENVDVIYSTDPDIATHAKSVGIECRGISDLPLAPSVQEALPFEGRAGDNEGGEVCEANTPETCEVCGATVRPEYDFSKGERGKFFRPNADLPSPIYLVRFRRPNLSD